MEEKSQHVVEYNVTDAAIAEMEHAYMGLTIQGLDDKKGFVAVHTARMVVKGKRVEVEHRRKELKADALAYGKKVDGEAKRIFGKLEPIESHLQSEEDKVVEEKKRIEDEKARIEQDRVDEIRAKIAAMQNNVIVTRNLTASGIRSLIAQVEEIDITEEVYQEFYQEALETGSAVLAELSRALQAQDAVELADEKRKAEAERLEKVRQEQEATQKAIDAERLKIQEEQDKLQAEKDGIEADKKAEQDRKDREEFERKAREEAQIQADRDAKEAIERVEAERIVKEKAEAEEKARQEALKPDKDKLLAWLDSYYLIAQPKCKAKKAKVLIGLFNEGLADLVKDIKGKVVSL